MSDPVVDNTLPVPEEPPPAELPPEPPSPEQLDYTFKAVLAQNKFQAVRMSSLTQSEEIQDGLQAVVLLCHEPFADHLAEVTAGVDVAIGQIAALRDSLGQTEPPVPPEPPAGPFTRAQIERGVGAVTMAKALLANTLVKCDEATTTLQITKQWCSEADAADHLTEVAAGVNGAIEQVARLRSLLGSTQT